MKVNNRVYLIGFSGTGKSAVVHLLAARLGCPAIDVDEQIVRHFGMPIAQVFARTGEAAFRAVERELVLRTALTSRAVVSVGGGAPVDPVSRAAMIGLGTVVLLDARPETILRRLQHDRTEVRPMLLASDPLARITNLKRQRASAYGQAHLTVQTDDLSPEAVADHILGWLRTSHSECNRPTRKEQRRP